MIDGCYLKKTKHDTTSEGLLWVESNQVIGQQDDVIYGVGSSCKDDN